MEVGVRRVYGAGSKRVARRYLEQLARHAPHAAAAAHELYGVAGPHGAELTDELFPTHRDELERAAQCGGAIEWLAVGDPCWHLSCSADLPGDVGPSDLAELVAAGPSDGAEVVVYELWLSRLWPVYADHWYRVAFSVTDGSFTYQPLPGSALPELAAAMRERLRSLGTRRLARRRCASRLDFLPPSFRRPDPRLFDLVFSTTPRSRLTFSARGYAARRLMVGSTDAATTTPDPARLLRAIPGLSAAWREERGADGRLLTRELHLELPPGGSITIRQDSQGRARPLGLHDRLRGKPKRP